MIRRRIEARLPADMVHRIDALVERWREALPGTRVARRDVIRLLLEVGMESPDAEPPSMEALIGKRGER